MPWIVAGAAVGAAGSIGGSLISSSTSQSAAKAQQQSQQNTLNWIQQVYGNTQNNLSPFVNTGQQAQSQLAGFYGLPGGNASGATQGFSQYMNTPFYQFPLQQANLATNRSLAASGLTNSGAQLRDISQLNSGYASQGLSQYLSGLGSLASGGQNAAAQLGTIGVGTGAQISGANTAYGNAGAAGAIGTANAVNSGIGGAGGSLQSLLQNSQFQNLFNSSSSSYGGPTNTISNPNVAGGTYQSSSNPDANF
jgi:hypothetical protein